jgi:maltose alpha-D-glucosyltransferase/alpha-amylase
MINYFDKNVIQGVCNSNEFKGWLLSRRWFGDKSTLSNLEFDIQIQYFEIIAERIFLTIIEVKTPNYSRDYFLPLIYYEKLENLLYSKEKTHSNILKLTENTFSKKLVITIENKQEVFTLNLLEAEFSLFFWKKILFDASISEKFPSLNLEMTLFNKQFEDKTNMKKVQNLIEAGIYTDRYEFSINQLGGGNTTNILFSLDIINKRDLDKKPISYVLKSYKDYSISLEPSILFVLVKNKFPNAPKIYGTIKVKDKETIGILEHVSNIGNIGEIFWNELNNMINTVFKDIDEDYSKFIEKHNISQLIKENCIETIKVSKEISNYLKNLHKSLILPEREEYRLESVDSKEFLKNYTARLNSIITDLLNKMNEQPESTFFNLPKISSILIDIKDVIERFRSEFKPPKIDIQPVHQDLHMEQILYNKVNNQYSFYFIDFEGDPQLSLKEKKGKFPVEKDLASFLRALSYIKFSALLKFIEKNLIRKDKYEVPEEILYNLYFRRAARPVKKILDNILIVLNTWELKLMGKILRDLDVDYTLITYFYIERALYELNYEILFRPNKIIIPILGLKEIVEKN